MASSRWSQRFLCSIIRWIIKHKVIHMRWHERKIQRDSLNPSETWLPEGEVCNTHGGPGLWCVILTRVSSLSPQVTDQGWWALAWHQADFACELESLALDLLILEGITGEWRLSFRLSPNEGMQLKDFRLPYYLGFHYKIWLGSWFVILLLKYEAHRGAATGPGNPKKSISQDMWLHP